MAIYHLCVSIGSRGGGQSAAAKADYIEREGKYKEGAEEVAHTKHGHMPEFTAADPRQYSRRRELLRDSSIAERDKRCTSAGDALRARSV